MAKNYTLIDGIALHKSFPDTFSLPSPEEIDELEVGMFAKIGVKFKQTRSTDHSYVRALWGSKVGNETDARTTGERFWVEITHIRGNMFDGVIDNNLIYSAHHGLKMKDKIKFGRRHILETLHVTGLPQ